MPRPWIQRQARTITVQDGEVYTRLSKSEYEKRRKAFDKNPPSHLADFDYDDWVGMGTQGGRPRKWANDAQRKQTERATQTAQEKLAQGKTLTYQERKLLGLIKPRPGAYKSDLGRRMTPAERKRAQRAREKGGEP